MDSCRECDPCRRGLEQFCEKGAAFTYNSTEMDRTTPTYGGYSSRIVVAEPYALKIPAGVDPAPTAPLLCAGITTYSPLRQWNCKKGDRVGVVGLGGLGHMAVKLAASMGAEVTVLSTSRAKEADARRLGAHAFASTRDDAIFQKLAGRFDLLILDYCARFEIGADVEVIPIQKVNEAYERMVRNDVRYRFVIDLASLN